MSLLLGSRNILNCHHWPSWSDQCCTYGNLVPFFRHHLLDSAHHYCVFPSSVPATFHMLHSHTWLVPEAQPSTDTAHCQHHNQVTAGSTCLWETQKDRHKSPVIYVSGSAFVHPFFIPQGQRTSLNLLGHTSWGWRGEGCWFQNWSKSQRERLHLEMSWRPRPKK